MSLFKKRLLNNYNLIEYKDDFLLLHCSKNDFIYAPFDGKLKITDNGCVLHSGDYKLYLSHIQCTMHDDVKAGDIIGLPMVGKINYRSIAYIGIKIYNKNEMQEPIVYLEHRDKFVDNIKEEIKSQPKRKSNKKKK